MIDRRIIFILEPFTSPYGGVGVIYRHAEILADSGIPVFVALSQKPVVDFYNTRAPLMIHGGEIKFELGDVVVIPEGIPKWMRTLESAPIKRIMFCQNQYYLPFTDNPKAGFAEFAVNGVIASSEAVRAFFKEVYNLADVPVIPYAIDPTMYFAKPAKRRQIVFMPRKLKYDAAFIRAAFSRKYVRYADVPWVAIDMKTQHEAAEIMAESDIFLSLSHQESFGLPPLEAMACGCLVAGFHGDGGREYMTSENGWWAETGDWQACVDGLAGALDLLQTGGSALVDRRKAMASTVDQYSPARMKEALLTFWRNELATPFI